MILDAVHTRDRFPFLLAALYRPGLPLYERRTRRYQKIQVRPRARRERASVAICDGNGRTCTIDSYDGRLIAGVWKSSANPSFWNISQLQPVVNKTVRDTLRNRYNGLSRKEICILFESYIAKSSKRYSFTIRDDVIIKKRQENGYFVIISGNQYASCIMCESSRYVMVKSRRITISDITYTLFCAYSVWCVTYVSDILMSTNEASSCKAMREPAAVQRYLLCDATVWLWRASFTGEPRLRVAHKKCFTKS